jgi:hypothetical protein
MSIIIIIIIIIITTTTLMLDLGFSKLVRYEQNGKVLFGDLQSHQDGEYVIKRLQGDLDQGFRPTGDDDVVKKVCKAIACQCGALID